MRERHGGEIRDENVDGVCSAPCRIAGVGPADGGARDRPGAHPPSGGVAHRPHGAADPGADVPAQHRARRPERHAATAVRGEGSGQRAQRPHRADRRYGVRPVQRLRRAHPHADGGAPRQRGLRYNEFHTTALCSPTRTALLSGRNHHVNNMGSITETATAFPGQTGQRPISVAPLAEMLRLNGYSTAAFGKSHETAAWEVSPSGPTDRWPTRSGFDKFYGFMGGETNQWAPLLSDGMSQVELPNSPNHHF